jgi:DNA-binding transcriptional ArsR family regulator
MADHLTPDYPLERELTLDGEQMRTLLEPTRTAIIELLGERAATTSELADALGKPKGTVGHHCKALEAAGLITVVRTKQVRAIEAKYYGRTARTFILHDNDEVDFGGETMLAEAAAELTRLRQSEPEAELAGITSLRYARIPDERAVEWARRLGDLIDEFTAEPRGGDRVYGFAVSLFPTLKPTLEGS